MTRYSVPQLTPPQQTDVAAWWAVLDGKTKPPRSLGRLEELAVRLHSLRPLDADPRAALVIFAADHGIAEAGVSAYPQAVTGQMLSNFAAGGAAINALCTAAEADLLVVDVGTLGPTPPGVRDCKVKAGTRSFLRGAAMTDAELDQALCVGRDVARELCRAGVDVIAAGEMGIANTTTASALTAALLKHDVDGVVGRGTGIDDTTLRHKAAVLRQALAHHGDHLSDPREVLRRLGGLEIAALCGLYLAAAEAGRAVLLDGFITGAAALCARALCPEVSAFFFAAHRSVEPGHTAQLAALGLTPLLQLDLRLGEGSGAALALPLFRAAYRITADMATFESAGVSGKHAPQSTEGEEPEETPDPGDAGAP